MDKIIIDQMQFYGYHGVYPEENKLGQRFKVDATLWLDLSPAGTNDDLNQTINYAEVYELTKKVVENQTHKLVETIAENISSSILKTFPIVQSCTIKVIKPDPPINGHYNSVAVEITRSRNGE
ncbi:dihydroneopterin aldolase [Alkalihalobacterium chitinilyticum]|uniref:7,8-dihydroneopterin aldolase n=1 Tax=Alkalihalobacterium chitinilyticum TaxID=2980103 RepID=A0ABT5VNW0_9BACI|nr:dihydroneopterin aldolase [Alkalihalobacterium chitinilyticum]MDE5415964.1 dihydroneopterin aldolase [Alkalihalobacterium chitinilyticum]